MPTTLPIDLLASSDTGSSQTDNLTNDDTPTLAGFAGVELFGATVDFTSDLDGILGSTTVGADGIWQMTLPQISQGNNWITATITAPDTTVTTETIKLGIDTYASVMIDQPVANGGVIDGPFTLTGTAIGAYSGDQVNITLTDSDNKTVSVIAIVSSGLWEIEISQEMLESLTLGAIAIDANVTDRAGNLADDAIAADGSVVNAFFDFGFYLADESNSGSKRDVITTDDSPTFKSHSASFVEGTVITFHSDIDGDLAYEAIYVGPNDWAYTRTLSEGLHTITITATTPSGFVGTNTTTVEIIPPLEVTIDQPFDNNGVIDGDFQLTGTLVGGTRVSYVLTDAVGRKIAGSGSLSDENWTVDISKEAIDNLDLGSVYLNITGADSAGNVAHAVIPANGTLVNAVFWLNLYDGSDSGISNSDELTRVTTPEFTGPGLSSAVGLGSVITFHSDIEGDLAGQVIVDDEYLWRFTVPEALSDGVHTITATSIAPDGFVSTGTVTITVDTLLEVTIRQPIANDGVVEGTFILSGTSVGNDDNGYVTVSITDQNDNNVTNTARVIDGLWSLDITTYPDVLDMGALSVTVTTKDDAGNQAQASIPADGSFRILGIDLLASSDLGISSTDNLTNDDTPTIRGYSGLAFVGDTVELTSDLDGVLGSTTVGVDGFWQITLPQLSQGNSWITATTTDADSNVVSKTLKLGVDTYAAITIDQPIANNGIIDGAFILSGTTIGAKDERVVTLILTDSASNTAQLTTTVSAGIWSVNVSEENFNTFEVGSVSVDVSVSDNAGNIAQANASIDMTGIDLLPSSDLGISSTDNLTNDGTPTIEGYAGFAAAGFTVDVSSNLDGALGNTTVGANGYWQLTLPQLSQGNNWITATITAPDTTVTTETIKLSIDTYATITIDVPSMPSVIGESVFFTGSVAGVEDGREVTITFTDSNNNTATASAIVAGSVWQVQANEVSSNSLLAGDITITAEVIDRAGNVATSATVTNMPFVSLGDIESTLLLDNGEWVFVFDGLNSLVVQRFDASFNPLTTPLSLTAPDVFDEVLLETIDTTTGNYALYTDGNIWTFDVNGNLLNTEPVRLPTYFPDDFDFSDPIEPTFLHVADNGFMLVKEYLSGTGSIEQIYFNANSTASILFFDANGIKFEEVQFNFFRRGGPGPAGSYENGSYLESIELVNLANGDTLVLLREYSGNSSTYASQHQGYVFSVDNGVVRPVFSFDLERASLLETSTVTSNDTSFTITTASDSVTIRYDSFYPEGYLNLPTVNEVDTSNTHPWLSGTFDADETTNLTISVDGKNYTLGVDANFYQHANNDNIWVLRPKGFYHLGEHDVVVTATNSNGLSVVDQTIGELTITRDMVAPRVNLPKQIYNKRPAIGGSFDEAATEELTVELDGTVYTLGVDAELSNHLNNKWVLNLSTLETPLSDGVYDVIVNTTDANSVTLQDASTGELTIGMLAPTVYELESTNFKPVLRGFYDADFGDGLTVTVNGDSYTLGVDGELTTHASNDNLWVLRPSNVLNFGNNDIQVTAIDTRGKDKTDITSDEIHIYQTKSQAADGDVLITQAGDDIVTINDNTFTQIDAGLGVDTLLLDGDAISLNFANIQGIDVVDMNDAALTGNDLNLTVSDVLNNSDNGMLTVLGGNDDSVSVMGPAWSFINTTVVDNLTFDVYETLTLFSDGATLLVEQDINFIREIPLI